MNLKILFTLAAAASMTTAAAEKVLTHVPRVVITQSGDSTVMSVWTDSLADPSTYRWITHDEQSENMSETRTLHFQLPFADLIDKNKNTGNSHNPYGKLTCPVSIYAGAAIPTGKSASGIVTGWEIGVREIAAAEIRPRKNGTAFRLGAGLGWRVMNVDKSLTMRVSERQCLEIVPADPAAAKAGGQISTFHITVPFTIEQPIGSHGFSISAGAELHLNTYTTASVKTELISGEKVTNTYKGLHQRIATVEFTGMLGWTPGVAVYVRYAPFNPFIDGYGPDYKTISVGGMLYF